VGGVGVKPIPPYRGEIMIQECNTKRYIYSRPVCINMVKTHKQLKKEMTCEQTPAREPVNFGRVIGTCIDCDTNITQYINLSGGDGGSEKICYPCVAEHFDNEKIPYDEWDSIELPLSDEIISKYDLTPFGVKESLDCGCILIDWHNGEKYIHLCDDHRFFITPKIIMTDLEPHTCNACDDSFHNFEMIMAPNFLGSKDYCKTCYKELADTLLETLKRLKGELNDE